jgi:hypothetical protein
MTTSRRYDGWVYAPLRFAVWVLGVLYLGRITYNNTLWDLRQVTALHAVVRTLSIAITLGFVYWNLFVVPPRLAAVMWATVAGLVGAVFVWKGIIETGVRYHDSLDPLDRSDHQQQTVESLDLGRRVAGKQLGDTVDDDD